MSPDQIINRIAADYRLPYQAVVGRDQTRHARAARRAAVLAVREQCHLSWPQIGRLFDGRDHTSMLHIAHTDVPAVTRRARRPRPPVCTVEGCSKPTRARGWCVGHYDRWSRHGDVFADQPLGSKRRSDWKGHGTRSSYNAGCRCDECKAGNREAKRGQYQRRTVPSWPVRRHVLALREAGMTQTEIAGAAGVSQMCVSQIARGQYATARKSTAAALLAVSKPCAEGCGQPALAGGRWCQVGGCRPQGRWSWSQTRRVA